MTQEITNNNAESSTINIRFKECNPSLPIKEVKPSRVNGFWTDKKELALLKEYANVFLPACKRGQHKEAWEQILTSVNEVNPSDPPLSYDSCRRAVDRLVGSYRKSSEESNVASLSGANRNRSEVEKAVYEIIKKKNTYDDLKKEGRYGAVHESLEIRDRRRVEKEANARNNEPRSLSPPVEEASSGSGSFRETEVPVETEATSGDCQNGESSGSLSTSQEK
ncbi:hypothetical protein CLU79DRAFT_887490 [Phycomyces nitens]|nr:hypothetical protein CLU79DRAFT_887490 [Phycomyces nitens]